MGITLFASGKIDTIEDIPRLIEDVKEIAEEREWKYRVIDDDFDMRPNASLAQIDSDTPGAVIKGTLGLKGVVMNLPAASCGVSDHDVRPSLEGRGSRGG